MRLVFADHEPHLKPNPRRDHMSGVPELSYSTLDRHGARVLAPGQVVRTRGRAAPQGTVYRYDQMLISGQVLLDATLRELLEAAVSQTGMHLDLRQADRIFKEQKFLRVPISSTQGDHAAVDAWSLLQRLTTDTSDDRLPDEVIRGIRLEHLLICEKSGPSASLPGLGSGEPPIGGLSYSSRRRPVDLLVSMPQRTPRSKRLRIAMLDTGVPSRHPWFDISDHTEGDDTFIVVDHHFQNELGDHSDSPAPPLDDPWEGPVHEATLIGEVASHFGHGTFAAGILRQVAPDVQIYSLRVAYNDGMAYEFEVTAALAHLAEQVETYREGNQDAIDIDLVLVPFGFVTEDPDDMYDGGLRDAVDRLTRLGIPIIAAAGNQSSERPFYPAALAAYQQAESSAPILSVGALNPNRSVSYYSNEGPWISCYATGTDLVSAFPVDAHGSRMPERRARSTFRDRYRESSDPSDFSSGCSLWSGTSFAAAVTAGHFANALEERGTGVDGLSAEKASERAHAAYALLKSR
jgi:hypothetical protein